MDRVQVDVGTDVNELREHLLRIEATVTELTEKIGRAHSIKEVSSFADIDGSTSDVHSDENEHARHRIYKPEIRVCNLIAFKNHFSEADASYACDVLVSDSLSGEDILEEQRLRDRLDEYAMDGSSAARRKAQMLVRESENKSRALRNDQVEKKWIQRVRIQSPFLIETLSRVHSESWTTAPRIYDRPFCTLAHHHDGVKRVLAELESQCERPTSGSNATTSLVDSSHAHNGEEASTPRDNLDESRANRDILRAYVDFIDAEILPDARKYTKLSHKDRATVRFSDLCYLFSPGDFLYRPAEGEKVGENRRSRVGQRLWRITRVNELCGHEGNASAGLPSIMDPDFAERHRHDFVVDAFHIDFTGEEFCIVQHSFVIPPFQGQKPINHLPFFPKRFAADCESFSEEASQVGKKVLYHLENRHAFYDAWTVTRSPQDGDVIDETGRILRHPEPINSEVIVDFREAFQFCPTWQPSRSVLKTEAISPTQSNDPFSLRRWSGKDRARLLYEVKEIVPRRTGVHGLQRNAFVTNDPFLKKVAHNDQMGKMTTARDIGVDEEQLLHCRVFAYVFRDRKFAQLDAGALKPATKSPSALVALKIPDAHKKMIQRSVEGYFINKRDKISTEDPRAMGNSAYMDVIPGKGAGLFFLLHGAPGVGKTMTAEAIAQANGKPLFQITSGDVGLTPEQVETSLRGIFRLASVWDCILLMDEVDTFFSSRSKGDNSVTKNALVSVFLRVLDYYEGILFLTTNRPGALDEAFKSRIHYKILYSTLSKDQTMEIWQHNIDRLRARHRHTDGQRPLEIREQDIMDFASEQFDINQRKRQVTWSGRQIRNAFLVAKCLAVYDAHKKQSEESTTYAPALLTREYFHMMNHITEEFDNYMTRVLGMNDNQLARELENRDDDAGTTGERVSYGGDRNDNEGSIRHYPRSRSPLSFDMVAPEQQRPRSYSNGRGSRPSIVTGVSLRANVDGFLQPSQGNAFDDSSRGGQNSPGVRHHQFEAYDNDTGYRNNSGPYRSLPASGRGMDRPFPSSANDGRDIRRQSDFESEQNYMDVRNEHGKRNRDIMD